MLGQLYRNGGRIPGAGEHGRGRTPAVLDYVPQSDYRTNHSESGAAVILWALYLAAVVSLGDDSLLACLKSIELRDTNQKSTLNLTAKLPSLLTKLLYLRGLSNCVIDRCCADDSQGKNRGRAETLELLKKGDLEGLVVKRKDGKYSQQTLWYKVLNLSYTQKAGRQKFFQRQ